MTPLLTHPENSRSRAALAGFGPGDAPKPLDQLRIQRRRGDPRCSRSATRRRRRRATVPVVDAEWLAAAGCRACGSNNAAPTSNTSDSAICTTTNVVRPDLVRGMVGGDRTGSRLLHRTATDPRAWTGSPARVRRGQPWRSRSPRRSRASKGRSVCRAAAADRAAPGTAVRVTSSRRTDDAEHAAGPRHQQALGEQLPNQASATGAERQAQRELAPPRHRARQQQHGDVGARDQQHEADHAHQQQQRLSVGRAQRVDPVGRRARTRCAARFARSQLRQRVGDEPLEQRVDRARASRSSTPGFSRAMTCVHQ